MTLPALAVDENVVAKGKRLSLDEVKKLLTNNKQDEKDSVDCAGSHRIVCLRK